jgi:glutathione S-transferase
MDSVKLYYWPIRGLKEPIAYLLEYLEIEYEYIPVKDDKHWESLRSAFFKKGYSFANLPLLEIDGQAVSEVLPIMTTLALSVGKPEMVPGDHNFARFLELYGVISDLFSDITRPAYSSKTLDAFRQLYLKACQVNKVKIESIDKLVGKQKWLLGETLSILDFKLAEIIDKMKAIEEDLDIDIISQYMNLDSYLGRFVGIPAIKSYRTSDKFSERPFNKDAVWG